MRTTRASRGGGGRGASVPGVRAAACTLTPTHRPIRGGGAARILYGRPGCRPKQRLSRSLPLIRVALAVEPPVLRDVLREILAQAPDLVLLDGAPVDDTREIPAHADVVVITDPSPENDTVPALMLYRSPRTRVLALSGDARHAFLYELRPHRTPLGELGRERLLAAVRAAAPGEAR